MFRSVPNTQVVLLVLAAGGGAEARPGPCGQAPRHRHPSAFPALFANCSVFPWECAIYNCLKYSFLEIWHFYISAKPGIARSLEGRRALRTGRGGEAAGGSWWGPSITAWSGGRGTARGIRDPRNLARKRGPSGRGGAESARNATQQRALVGGRGGAAGPSGGGDRADVRMAESKQSHWLV